MVEELQDLDLTAHLLVHLELADAIAIQYLDGHLVPGELVLGHCGANSRVTLRLATDGGAQAARPGTAEEGWIRRHEAAARQPRGMAAGSKRVCLRGQAVTRSVWACYARRTLPKLPMPKFLPRR